MMTKTIIAAGVCILACAGIWYWANRPFDPLPEGTVIDRVEVRKDERVMRLMKGGRSLREYRIALGRCPAGPKRCEGDGRTPEGGYTLDYRNPKSRFFLSYHISYPEPRDRRMADSLGCMPGGHIMIHGAAPGHAFFGRLYSYVDWTNGCIAITNPEMAEFWRVVPVGTPITIYP